ncbi:MAG TPA: response regulator, partial [Archangium sp.]|nr:response regulator [Archangium sp.]
MAFMLVAEPAAPISGALRRFLESAGHEVMLASDVPDAMGRVREMAPAVVMASVSDGFDGEALCRQVKA